eukprot:5037406-Pyramimonas_sp.AAC.1
MSRLHVGDLTPHLRLKQAYSEKGPSKKYKLQIMRNALAASPFQDEHLTGEIDKARGQNAEGSQEQL